MDYLPSVLRLLYISIKVEKREGEKILDKSLDFSIIKKEEQKAKSFQPDFSRGFKGFNPIL